MMKPTAKLKYPAPSRAKLSPLYPPNSGAQPTLAQGWESYLREFDSLNNFVRGSVYTIGGQEIRT
jgi:hypothetical protein